MGGGKSSTSTSSVTIPPEVLARYNSVNATAEQAAQTPFQQYSTDPNAFVAPINSTQQAGINQIANSANAAQPYYGAATGLTMAGAGPANLGGLNTGQYMSPFLGSVYGTALAGQSQQNAQQQSNLAGQAITSGAFGGDRSNIAQANLAYQQNLANNQTNANLLNTGYQNAQSVAQQQQGAQLAAQQANLARLTGAGQQLAGLGAGVQTAAQTGGQNVLAAGTVPQQTQQAGLTALYNQFLQQQAYPFQTAQFLANIAEGTGALSGSTTTTTQPSSFFSDRRLKHDIKKIGETKDGLPIYKFKYKGDPTEQTHVGFMAQDVEKVHPEAVGMSHGYKTVDYDKATEGRHHRYAGGLIPNHMGGPVSEGHAGEEYARGGYALDGAVVDPTDLKAILAAQQQMYAPFSQNGMNISGVPGAGKGIVPAANLPVPKLVTSNFKPQQQQSGLQQLSSAANQLNSSGDTAQGIWNKGVAAKDWLNKQSSNDNSSASNPNTTVNMGKDVNMQQAEMPQQYDDPTQGSGQYRGGLVREHHMYGDSVGDGSDMQYDDQKGYMGFLGLGSAQQLSPQQLQSEQKDMSEGKMPSQPPSGAAQMLKGATDIYSLGKDASGLYDKAMSALKSVTGTPAASSAAPVTQTAVDAAAPAVTDAATAAAPAAADAGLGTAADVGAGAVADAGLGAAADVGAGAIADAGIGAAADVGLGAAASDLAPLLMFASRGGVIPREHHDGPNDTNNQSNVVGDGQTDTTDQPQYKIQPQDLEDMPDYKQDVIKTIYDGESGGRYNILNGGQSTFDTNGPHPNVIGKNGQSTAAGAGQFINSTWNNITGGAPMTKGYQDAATWQLASQDYFKRTGRDLDTDVQEKGFSPEIKKVLSPTWASLQTTGQKIGNAISGGLSGAKNFVSDIISPSPANAQTLNQQGGQQQQGTDWEKIVVPLLSGIGGMANSNSRYLGAAILQGLGAGANAYENVLTNQAQRGLTGAQTDIGNTVAASNAQTIAQKSSYIDPATGQPWIILADGKTRVTPQQWVALGRPPRFGDIQAGIAINKTFGGAGASAANASVPDVSKLKSNNIGAPDVQNIQGAQNTSQTPWGIGQAGIRQLQLDNNSMQNNMPLRAQTIKNNGDIMSNVTADYNNAVNQGSTLNILTHQLLAEPETGITSPGVLSGIKNQALNSWNSLMTSIPGGGGTQFVINPDDLNKATYADKLSRGIAFAQTSGADQHSLQSLQTALTAQPNSSIPKDVALDIVSSMYADKQKRIDKYNYIQDVIQADANSGGYGNYNLANALRAFNVDHSDAQYQNEKHNFRNLLGPVDSNGNAIRDSKTNIPKSAPMAFGTDGKPVPLFDLVANPTLSPRGEKIKPLVEKLSNSPYLSRWINNN